MGAHGLVVEDIHFADMAGLLAQLGVQALSSLNPRL